MIWVRIINFIFQVSLLVYSVVFLYKLYKKQIYTPTWKWFMIVNVFIWLWVFGRFLETIIYLFLPNNSFYVFAANFQYIGVCGVISVYLTWNLYCAGLDKIANNYIYRFIVFAIPTIIILIVFTNNYHHLFYTKLIMGEKVGHGIIFYPCLSFSYSMLFIAFLVSVYGIFKQKEQIFLKLIVFSMIPLFPAAGTLFRTISGIDLIDITPLVLGISFYCMYLVVFKYKYVNIIAISLETVMSQTSHPVGVHDGEKFVYLNKIAQEKYKEILYEVVKDDSISNFYEKEYLGIPLIVNIHNLDQGKLFSLTDLSEYYFDLQILQNQKLELERIKIKLEEESKNNDAYIDALSFEKNIIHEKIFTTVFENINQTFNKIHNNFIAIKSQNDSTLFDENMSLAKNCLKKIQKIVSGIKG